MIQVLTNASDVCGLGPAWNQLAERFGSPLLRHEWFASCAEAFCPPARLQLLVARDGNGEVSGIAPLALGDLEGTETLEILGSSALYEPTGLLYRDEPALEELISATRAINRVAVIRRLPLGCPEARMFERVWRGRSILTVQAAPASPWLPIGSCWQEFDDALPSRNKYDLKRAYKRAQSMGKMETEVLAPAPSDVEAYLGEMSRIEATGWKGRAGTALSLDNQVGRFFRLYTQRTAAANMLRLGFLRINGQIAAYQMAVEYARRLWLFKVGYDETFSRCSPGMLLMHRMIKYAFEQRLEAFEFLGTEAQWLRFWTDQVHEHVAVRVCPLTARSLAAVGKDYSRRLLRRAFGDTPNQPCAQ